MYGDTREIGIYWQQHLLLFPAAWRFSKDSNSQNAVRVLVKHISEVPLGRNQVLLLLEVT